MAEDLPEEPVTQDETEVQEARRPWSRAWKIALGVVAALVVLIGGALLWLDSDSGHRFAARKISGLQFANGMTISVGDIDGSLYGKMTVRDLAIGDPQGVFFTVPKAVIDWRPFAYISNHIDIRSLIAPTATLKRLPQLRPSESEGPLLPDLDIDVGKLQLGRLEIEQPVTGQRHLVGLNGSVHIADRRAVVKAKAAAFSAPGVAGGDRIDLALDATPEKNRLDISADVTAPADGLIAGLAGLQSPLSASINGKGDWDKWDGRLDASYGGKQLAGLALTARKGTVATKGTVQPGLFLSGSTASMFNAPTEVDLAAALNDRRADLKGHLANDNFRLAADGLVDLGQNRFQDLKLDFQLMRPAAIGPNFSGDAVNATFALDGAFSTPAIDYNITANRLGFDTTSIVGLAVSGKGRVEADRAVVPVHARAARIVGLDAAAGELLTNVRIDGDLAVKGPRILSDNLAIRSDRIDATAVLVADLSTGLYTGGLNGRVGNYEVASVGRFDIVSNLDLKTSGNGFQLAGTVQARSREIFNGTARDFLGGNGLIAANVAYGSDGVARVTQLRVAAPEFRMTGGSGSYSPNGRIAFKGQGVSDQYGPLAVEVSGTLQNPTALVIAERPGFGVGLANVRAELKGSSSGYSFIAKGDSDYGPFDADLTILSGKGPLTIDIQQANFAGIAFDGRIQQSAQGPFTGTLGAHGSGIDGQVQLMAAGEFQRAVIAARAKDAELPGTLGVTIGRAIIDADVTLYDQPQVQADVQLADFSYADLDLNQARAIIDYRGGTGSAKLLASGRRGTSFSIAANADLSPELWRVALRGSASGVGFQTVEPARIKPEGGEYELLPTRLKLRQGSMQLAGHYGQDLVLQSRLASVDLSLLRPFMPNLGLGGNISGSLDYEQRGDAFPHADARLAISDFTRTGLASVSQPVDIKLVGRLLPDGGNMRAIFERRGTTVGRMQVNLQPLGPESGSWQTRLAAAPLSGGIRYNGPASTLFSLAALADQHLSGAIGMAADFSGRVQSPVLTGVVRANDLTYVNDSYGTRLTNMRVRGSFTNDRLEVEELTANAGNGTVSGKGFVSLSSAKGYPMQLGLELNNAQLADNQGLSTRATGSLEIVNSADQPALIKGTIRLPETRYRIVRQGAAEIRTLTGIRRKSDEAKVAQRKATAKDTELGAISGVPSNWRLQVDVLADNQVYVSGMGMEAEWSADIRLRGTTGDPEVQGGITLIRGTLSFAGRSFELQPGGRLTFNGGDPTNPRLSISAQGEADDVNISISVTGSAVDPQISFSSTPALPQDEIMSRILFGNSIGELSALQAVQLASSLNALRGGGGGLNPLGVLQSAAGIDRLRIMGADEATGRGTSLAVGKYISNDIYVEIVTDTRGFTATQIEISLTPALSVLSQVGSFGTSNVNLQYRKDY